jgi:hypothetical protein
MSACDRGLLRAGTYMHTYTHIHTSCRETCLPVIEACYAQVNMCTYTYTYTYIVSRDVPACGPVVEACFEQVNVHTYTHTYVMPRGVSGCDRGLLRGGTYMHATHITHTSCPETCLPVIEACYEQTGKLCTHIHVYKHHREFCFSMIYICYEHIHVSMHRYIRMHTSSPV